MPFPTPNGEQTFVDANGDPYTGGSVYSYVPGTTVPSPTYADEGLTVLNPNPVTLDGAGRSVMWTDTLTRQVLYDMFGTLIWDRETGITIDNIPGNLTVGGNFEVKGNSQFDGSVNVSGPLSAQDGLGVNGGATINGGETVNGGLNTDNINNSGNISTNSLSANGITDNGNLNVGGTLTVTGPSNLNGGLTTSSLHDTGNATIDGNLAVGGNETVAGDLTVGGKIIGGDLGGGTLPFFPAGSGGDFIVSMQLLWGSYSTQIPPAGNQIDVSQYHEPFGALGGWYIIVTTNQARQFTIPLSPSNYPTLPYEADTFTPITFPPNRYIFYPPDPSTAGPTFWIVEVMPDGSFTNWTDNASGGIVWTVLSGGAAGMPNNDANGPMGTGNLPYTPWPTFLTTGLPGIIFPPLGNTTIPFTPAP